MKMRAKQPFFWLKLAPLWVVLWLITFGGPDVWLHLDGSFCGTCTFAAPAFDSVCQDEPQAQHRAQIGISAPEDCRQCCAPVSQLVADKLVSPASQAAILSARISLKTPSRRETRLTFRGVALPLDALPRPPPRGRAPPFVFSISPLELLKTQSEHEKLL